MPAECFGSVTGLLLGAGLGIIAVVSLTSSILFLKYFEAYTIEYPDTYYYAKNPNSYLGDTINSAGSAGIFSLFSALCAIGAISVSGILKGSTTILLGIGGASCAFAIASIISEGMFYDYTIKYSALGTTTYRNISSAQRYIRKAYEDGYIQAEKNLVAKYPELKDKFDSWKTVKERFGEEYNDTSGETHIFTYATLLDNLNFWPKWNQTLQIEYNAIEGTMEGVFYYESNEYRVIIASLNFNYTKQNPKPYRKVYCWNETANSGLSCKILDVDMSERYIIPVALDFFETPFELSQKILKAHGKKIKYLDNLQRSYQNYDVEYTITAPVAYRLVTYDEIKDYENNKTNPEFQKQIYFEKPTHYYRVNPKSYIKAKFKDLIKENNIGSSNKLDQFYYCVEQPTSYHDTNSTINLPGKPPQSKCSSTLIEEMKYSSLRSRLDNQFRHTGVGKYPSFFTSYRYKKYAKDNIFVETSLTRNSQFAIGAIILQIVGMLLYGIGKGFDFIGGGGSSD